MLGIGLPFLWVCLRYYDVEVREECGYHLQWMIRHVTYSTAGRRAALRTIFAWKSMPISP